MNSDGFIVATILQEQDLAYATRENEVMGI